VPWPPPVPRTPKSPPSQAAVDVDSQGCVYPPRAAVDGSLEAAALPETRTEPRMLNGRFPLQGGKEGFRRDSRSGVEGIHTSSDGHFLPSGDSPALPSRREHVVFSVSAH